MNRQLEIPETSDCRIRNRDFLKQKHLTESTEETEIKAVKPVSIPKITETETKTESDSERESDSETDSESGTATAVTAETETGIKISVAEETGTGINYFRNEEAGNQQVRQCFNGDSLYRRQQQQQTCHSDCTAGNRTGRNRN